MQRSRINRTRCAPYRRIRRHVGGTDQNHRPFQRPSTPGRISMCEFPVAAPADRRPSARSSRAIPAVATRLGRRTAPVPLPAPRSERSAPHIRSGAAAPPRPGRRASPARPGAGSGSPATSSRSRSPRSATPSSSASTRHRSQRQPDPRRERPLGQRPIPLRPHRVLALGEVGRPHHLAALPAPIRHRLPQLQGVEPRRHLPPPGPAHRDPVDLARQR